MGGVTGPTLLADYLGSQKLSYAAFARLVGADRARIQRCASGDRGPGLALALAIEQATEGSVPAASWVGPTVVRQGGRRKAPRGTRRLVRRNHRKSPQQSP